jgi:hypothetical protein
MHHAVKSATRAAGICLLFLASTAFADEYPCDNIRADGTILISDFNKCLLKHFPDGAIEEGVLDVFVDPDDPNTRVRFTFVATPFDKATLSSPKCTSLTQIIRQDPVNVTYIWCPNPGVPREAWRDVYSRLTGTPTYKPTLSKAYKCSVATDLATMPDPVKAQVCQ